MVEIVPNTNMFLKHIITHKEYSNFFAQRITHCYKNFISEFYRPIRNKLIHMIFCYKMLIAVSTSEMKCCHGQSTWSCHRTRRLTGPRDLYTPGQKFIEFFFNELSHRNNGEYQQFVNSGMVTYQFSKKLRNIVCVGTLATVQCP